MKTLTTSIPKKATNSAFFQSLTLDELEQRCDDPARDLRGDTEIRAILAFNHEHGFSLLAQDGKALFSIRDAEGRPVQYRTIEQAIEVLQDMSGLSPDVRLDISESWKL
jgi:hypothetical protein